MSYKLIYRYINNVTILLGKKMVSNINLNIPIMDNLCKSTYS